jgi:hypothetical protein
VEAYVSRRTEADWGRNNKEIGAAWRRNNKEIGDERSRRNDGWWCRWSGLEALTTAAYGYNDHHTIKYIFKTSQKEYYINI